MQVDTVSQVLGWINNRRITEVRNTYHYDKGNTVTTVSTRSQEFMLIGYDKNGMPSNHDQNKGRNVDLLV
jgi:hypothetical protein